MDKQLLQLFVDKALNGQKVNTLEADEIANREYSPKNYELGMRKLAKAEAYGEMVDWALSLWEDEK